MKTNQVREEDRVILRYLAGYDYDTPVTRQKKVGGKKIMKRAEERGEGRGDRCALTGAPGSVGGHIAVEREPESN